MGKKIEKNFEIKIVLDKMSKDLDTINGKINTLAVSVKKVSDQLKELAKNKGLTNVIAVLNQYNNVNVQVTKSAKKLTDEQKESNKIAKLQAQVRNSEKNSLNQLRAQIALNNIAYNKMSAAQRTGTIEGRNLGKALAEQRKQLRQITVAAGDFTKNIGNYSSAFTKLKGSIYNIYGKFKLLTQTASSLFSPFTDFETQMSMVKAVSGATGETFEKLSQKARDLGESTEYTASQVADLQLAYSRLGFAPDEIMEVTGATLDLATATGEDLAKSADVAGATLRGFGLNANEMQRVVDVMAQSFNSSALQLDSFKESMKTVAPIAAQANISIEETTAMLGILADRGIRGTQAGTALRRIFTDIAKSGGSVQERIAELSDKGITLSDAFDEVGRNAMTALTVLSKSKGGIDELTEKLNNASGAAQEAANTMRDNLSGDIKKAQSAFQELIISIVDFFAPAIRSFIQVITTMMTNFKLWFNSMLIGIPIFTALYKVVNLLKAHTATSTAIITANTAARVANIASLRAQVTALQAASQGTKLLAAAKYLLAGNIKMAGVALKAFWAVLRSNPLGSFLMAVTAVISALTLFRKKTDESKASYASFISELSKEKSVLKDLQKTATEAAQGTNERAYAIKMLNEKYGEYLPYMLSEKSTNEEIKTAIDAVNNAIEENIRLKYLQQSQAEIVNKLAKTEDELFKMIEDDYRYSDRPERLATLAGAYRDAIDQIKAGGNAAKIGKNFTDRFHVSLFGGIELWESYAKEVKEANNQLKVNQILFGSKQKQKEKPEEEKNTSEIEGAVVTIDTKEYKKNKEAQAKEAAKQAAAQAKKEREEREKQIVDNAKAITKLETDLEKQKNDAIIAAMKDGADKKIEQQRLNEAREIKELLTAKNTATDTITNTQSKLDPNSDEYKKFEEQKAEFIRLYEERVTQIKQNGENARAKIIADAKDEELKAVEMTSDYFNEAQAEMTKRAEKAVNDEVFAVIEAENKKRAEFEKTQKETLLQAQQTYETQKTIIEKTEKSESNKKNKLLQNEIELRKTKVDTYIKELEFLTTIGQIDSEKYNETLDNLKKIQTELTGLVNGDLTVNENGDTENNSFWDKIFNGKDPEEIRKELVNQAIDLTQQVSDAIFDAEQSANERRLNAEKKKIESAYKIESKLLDDKRDKGLISEKKYQEELQKLEDEKAAKEEQAEREAFEREKSINIKQALMNTALGIAKAIATYAWPYSLIPAAFAAAQGAIQVAAISSQKYAQGGVMNSGDKMAVVEGRNHAQGGHQIYLDNKPIGEIEGGELLAVVNKRDTRRLAALSKLNSIHGRKFADGGIMNATIPSPAPYYSGNDSSNAIMIQMHENTMAMVTALSNRIDNLKVYVSESDITETQKDILKTKVKASF